MVTLPGVTFPSRVAAGQLHCLGLPELIAKDANDYCEIAIKLGKNNKYRQKIRKKVWENRTSSPLFNIHNYWSEWDSKEIRQNVFLPAAGFF